MESTFSHQKNQPVLAVPELSATCKKLIEWAEPLLTEEQLNKAKGIIADFQKPGGDGEKLQQNLIHWANQKTVSNWAAPVWKNLYLEARYPLPINSNVFYYLKRKLDERAHSQAHIASALIASVCDFIELIDKEQLTADMQKDQPLCMNQYKNIFSSIRIPRAGTDEFKVASCRRFIVVMHAQRMYQVSIMDEAGYRRTVPEIEADLQSILTEQGNGNNIGLLTTLPRESWAKSREQLLQVSVDNQNALETVNNAAFTLCLDENSPDEITEISRLLLHGDGKDRYFDKTLQFIVFNNGKSGINFEHTGVDGSAMLRMIGHIYSTIDTVSVEQLTASSEHTPGGSGGYQEIRFDLDDELADRISTAKVEFDKHIANTQTKVLNFDQFGKEQIKQFGVSPDAFVQLAMQLAEYKLYGKFYSAYEAVMTRTFLDGRIDVLYTVSPESSAFIKALSSNKHSLQEKQNLLHRATVKHVARAKECRFGEGVYSHCLALQYRFKEVGHELDMEALPELFSSQVYKALTESVVCTSTTSEYGVDLAGYGPIVDEGYGIRYFIRGDSICFNMTSRTALKGNLEKMNSYIEQSLLEMASIMSLND